MPENLAALLAKISAFAELSVVLMGVLVDTTPSFALADGMVDLLTSANLAALAASFSASAGLIGFVLALIASFLLIL